MAFPQKSDLDVEESRQVQHILVGIKQPADGTLLIAMNTVMSDNLIFFNLLLWILQLAVMHVQWFVQCPIPFSQFFYSYWGLTFTVACLRWILIRNIQDGHPKIVAIYYSIFMWYEIECFKWWTLLSCNTVKHAQILDLYNILGEDVTLFKA